MTNGSSTERATTPAVPGAKTDVLVVFDLDGTLLTRDSFMPFLAGHALRRPRLGIVILAPFLLLAYACRLISARSLKQCLLKGFLGGESDAAIREHAERFCRSWIARHCRAVGMERLRHHQAAGHRIILESASPSVYVPIIARYLGIPEVVCTRVKSEGELCTGKIEGPNCKGEAKVSLLRDYLGRDEAPIKSYAYGDSMSDLPLLRWVRKGFLLHKGAFQRVPDRHRLEIG
jgi:HAD superfamily hydrolase (TIGR01490 family)